MKFHFVSESGDALGAAYQAQLAGHEVTAHLPEKCEAGRGLVQRTTSAQPHKPQDAVIFEGAHHGKIADELRADAWRVIAGGKWCELLAKKGDYHKKVITECGLTLAEDVEGGVPFFLTDWYEQGKWREQPVLSFVENRMMAGDAGAWVSDVGSYCVPISPGCDLVERLLLKLNTALSETQYAGPVSIVGVVADERLSVLALAPGLNAPLLPALTQLIYEGAAGYFGEEPPRMSADYGLAIRLTIPPWPWAVAQPNIVPHFRLERPAERYFWPHDIRLADDDFAYSGGTGTLGWIAARGRPFLAPDSEVAQWDEARGRALNTIGNISVEGVQYRIDVGGRGHEHLQMLTDFL